MPDAVDAPLQLQDLSSLFSGMQPPQAQTQSQSTQPQVDLSSSPILQVRGTHYGYKGDPNTDPNSAKGIGAWDNQLQDQLSVAFSPDIEARLQAQPNEQFLWTGADGTKRMVTFGDRTSSALRGRVDFYDKSGQLGDLGEGTISRVGAQGQTVPMFQESDVAAQKKPASYGMRVGTTDDVARYNNWRNAGGDPSILAKPDLYAIALAKDPDFFTKDQNFEAYYQDVYKPLKAQSGAEVFNNFMKNLGPTFVDTLQNVGAGLSNVANQYKDQAELAFRKMTGQTQDTGYQALTDRLSKEMATTAQGGGQALSDAWNFITGVGDGVFQASEPLAQLTMGRDPQSHEQIDRVYAHALQKTVGLQQMAANLGNQLQSTVANANMAIGGLSDLGHKIATATPDERVASGIATVVNPLNFVGAETGEAVVGALKPLFFEKGLQASEDLSGASAKKLVYDSSQILPQNPELSAARPGYIETRNIQAGLAPAARVATQDVNDAAQRLADHLTSSGKIAGDPGTTTAVANGLLQATGATMGVAGQAASVFSKFPEFIGKTFSMGLPPLQDAITDGVRKYVFGTVLHHFGPVGAGIETALEHLPEVGSAVKELTGAMGQELMMGEATAPFWQRVHGRTNLISKGTAAFLDSPAMQTATAVVGGGVAGAATGAALGGLQGMGSMPGGGLQGTLGGAFQGGIFGMAGGGLGQWQKFRDPNQYLLQARGDWKRYRDVLSQPERANFDQLSSTNQLILAQHAQQFPGLRVQYINDPVAPAGFHYLDSANRSNIQINLAAPNSVIRGTMAHELTHAATTSGMMPEILDTLIGNPQRGQKGQYTALDASGEPLGIDPATGRYQTDQNFANLRNQYLNLMTQNGLPTSHLDDAAIAKEVYAEHGVDYMLSGGGLLDAANAFRPGLFSRNAMKTALAKIGYTFDGNSKMIGSPSGSVGGTGLFTDLQRNPDLMKMAQTYAQTGWREGNVNSEEVSTRRFTRKDMQNPATAETWLQNAPEIMRDPETGNAIRNPLTGEPAYRSPKQVAQYNAKFADALRSGLDALPESQRMDLGYRKDPDGTVFTRYLPDNLLNSLAKTNEYNPRQIADLKMLSRVLADAGSPGMEMRLFYHKALSAGKKYGSFEGTEKFAVPYGFEISGKDNVSIKSADFNQLMANYQRVMKRAPYQGLWKTENEFDQDAHTYFTNHANGQPGDTGIGQAKRDAINALANLQTVTQREANLLVDKLPQSTRPIIKSYRIDRASQISPTGAKRPFISEEQYYQMNRNYLPRQGTAPEQTPQGFDKGGLVQDTDIGQFPSIEQVMSMRAQQAQQAQETQAEAPEAQEKTPRAPRAPRERFLTGGLVEPIMTGLMTTPASQQYATAASAGQVSGGAPNEATVQAAAQLAQNQQALQQQIQQAISQRPAVTTGAVGSPSMLASTGGTGPLAPPPAPSVTPPQLPTTAKTGLPPNVGNTVNGAFITHYGYAGDANWDPSSGKGIGDRNNRLAPLTSVALTSGMRQHLFNTSGPSTGKTFQWGGQTYQDDDTAPESGLRIDVFNPAYTGIDKGVTQQQFAQRRQLMGLPKLYASGGAVQASGPAQRGVDKVPALLTSGEYVLTKEAVKRIGLAKLEAMNRGEEIT